MYENNNMNQGAAAPEKKNGGSWAWLICILVGLILFVLGFALYKIFGKSSSMKVKDYSESFSVSDVRKLDIDMGWGDLTIVKSEDDNIVVDAKNVPEEFGAEVKNGTFRTFHSKKKFRMVNLFDLWDNDSNETTVKIYLPEKEYSSFALDLGAGETTVSDISCDQLRVNCGAGQLNLSNIRCSSSDIDCGAGQVNITDINCEGLFDIDGGAGDVNISGVLGSIDADQGVGEFEFTGTVNGNIDADGGVGEMTFNLTNPAEDFAKNGGKYKLDIDTGVGAANVYYNQG